MSLEAAAVQLVALAANPDIPRKMLDAMIDEHWPCFGAGEMCQVCEYIDEEVLDGLLPALASNTSSNAEQQQKILEAAYLWQGAEYQIVTLLAANTNISDAMKITILDPGTYSGWEDFDDQFGYIKGILNSNPRFTREEISNFVANFND